MQNAIKTDALLKVELSLRRVADDLSRCVRPPNALADEIRKIADGIRGLPAPVDESTGAARDLPRGAGKTIIAFADLRAKGIVTSKNTLWRLEKKSMFPKRVLIGSRRYGWVEEEVDAHINELIANRDAGSATPAKTRRPK